MALSSSRSVRRQRSALFFPAFNLARWQIGRGWRLLGLTGIGMIATVLLACTIPLYSWLTLTAGLRDIFATPGQSDVSANAVVSQVSRSAFNSSTDQLNAYVAQDLGTYVDNHPRFEVLTSGLHFLTNGQTVAGSDLLELFAQDMNAVHPHVQVVKGRLPQATTPGLEIALEQDAATYLHLSVGSQLTVQMQYTIPAPEGNAQNGTLQFPLRVSGIVKPLSSTDTYWHGHAPGVTTLSQGFLLSALIPSTAFLSAIEKSETQAQTTNKSGATPTGNAGASSTLQLSPNLQYGWYYHIDPLRVDANTILDLRDALETFRGDAPVGAENPPIISNMQVRVPSDALLDYNNHISVAALPTDILTALVVGLLLFFISLMADLLVQRQEAAIAVLRSRGASRSQIFTSLLVQCFLLSVLALVIGSLLVFPVLDALIKRTLPANQQGVLDLVRRAPLQALLQERWLLLGAVIAIFAVTVIATYRASRYDVLMLRRETSRSTKKPFWQRLYLDIFAAVLALAAYGVSLYLVSSGLLTSETKVLLQAPLILISSLLLLLAGALLFLRLFPLLLRLALTIANRGRGVVSTLGLGMMARAPQQSVRMILLLTFALAFVVFSLVFSASQAQHVSDVAAYQTGADFSGSLSGTIMESQPSTKQIEQAYSKIRGVTHVTVGNLSFSYLSSNDATNESGAIRIVAINPDTFVNATTWANGSNAANLNEQIKKLGILRKSVQESLDKAAAGKAAALPVFIDTHLADRFHMKVGSSFNLYGSLGTYPCLVLGQVPWIPSVNDNAGNGKGEDGLLVDFQSLLMDYNHVYAADLKQGSIVALTPNYAWLRTRDDASSLATVRKQVTQKPLLLGQLNDRRSLQTTMYKDPLYLNFAGVLALGAIAPVLLALVGNLLVSWWNARNRIDGFVVLRALGTSASQLANVLLSEQAIIYLTALVLGLLFGLVLSTLALPALVFTGMTSGGVLNEGGPTDAFSIQNVPPVQVVLPQSLFIAIGALIVLCIVVLGIMVQAVMRPSISQSLRLNED